MPFFMYAVSKADHQIEADLRGIDEAPVYSVAHADLAVVVSEYDGEELVPRRKTLAQFQQVMSACFGRGVVLPMSFGSIADDTEEIERLLAEHAVEFAEKLSLVEGRGEFVLRVSWQGANLFGQFVERYPELGALRDAYFVDGRTPSQDERIHLGQVFEQFLKNEREQITRDCLQSLQPHVHSHRELGHRNESSLCSLALLVGRDCEEVFADAVEKFASWFSDDHLFELSGPSAPYTFTELRIT